MKQKSKATLSGADKKLKRQQSLLEKYKKQDTRLKWAIGAAIVIIVLLLLLLGFATDWTAGLRKDKTTKNGTPISSALDAATGTAGDGNTANSSDTPSDTTTGRTSDSGSDTSSTKNTTGTTGSTNTTTGTTTNNTTTNNTTTATTTPSTPSTLPTGLLDLYTNSSVGDSINSILQRSTLVGISPSCHTDVLIQICDFTVGGNTVTIRNLLGTGLVTSITKNF